MEINLSTLAKHFSDEGAAWELVEKMRWKDNGPTCPHCGSEDNSYFLKSKSGVRTTKAGNASYRRIWKCADCRKQFSVLVGTIFEGTHVPLSKWLLAIYMMCADKNGVAAYELRRTLGVTNKTAWFMNHRIREAMKAGPLANMLRGTVVADETWIGGRDRNRHVAKRNPRGEYFAQPTRVVPGTVKGNSNPGPLGDKTIVLTLIDRDRGVARSRVIPDVTGATLRKAIAEQVDMASSVLYTDGSNAYKALGGEFIAHKTVDHSQDEYVRYEGSEVITSNAAENYFSQLKRSLDGTHHHVSREHLHRYLAEFDYRYTTRKMRDSERMADLMTRTGGRRLTYRTTVMAG